MTALKSTPVPAQTHTEGVQLVEQMKVDGAIKRSNRILVVDGSTSRSFPPRALRLALVSCAILAGVLVSAAAPVLAAGAPEAPVMGCQPPVVPAGGPFVCGKLNPHSKETLTGAYFMFSAGSSCTGGTRVEVEGFAGQAEEGIEVRAVLGRLAPGTEYAYCLVAVNSSGEKASAPLTFTTTAEPRIEPASAVTSASAVLEGTLEPAGVKLEYEFSYGEGSSCEGGVRVAEAEGENGVSAAVAGLAPDTEYTVCLQAKGNEGGFVSQGETNVGRAGGVPVQFKTPQSRAEVEAREARENEEALEQQAGQHARQVAAETAVREAAARKRLEEEAAASHMREEEVQGRNKHPREVPDTGGIALAGTSISVQPNGTALVKLNCLGVAGCRGKLRLRARVAAKGNGSGSGSGKKASVRAATIGTVSYTIAGDETKTVKLDLNAAGRALFSADRGRLSASLEILEVSPGAKNTQTKTVRLVQQRAPAKTGEK